MNFDALFVNPNGRTARAEFIPALLVLIAALAFYAFLVTGRTAHFCMLVLMYPTFVLLTRRVRDMGQAPALVIAPLVITLVAYTTKLGYASLGSGIDPALPWAALVVTAAFAVWGCVRQ
ncbi:MAG TPA: DUF805 domain-containing protein [Candidatus Acidoferrum sp.]|nr:DUF805 domain-containing protein [Candidatus Acidoferrum sp.]